MKRKHNLQIQPIDLKDGNFILMTAGMVISKERWILIGLGPYLVHHIYPDGSVSV